MSLLLPPSDHPAREHVCVHSLAERRWVTLAEARASARRFFETGTHGVRWLTFNVLSADGHVRLISIGPRGGRKIRWDFGALAA